MYTMKHFWYFNFFLTFYFFSIKLRKIYRSFKNSLENNTTMLKNYIVVLTTTKEIVT